MINHDIAAGFIDGLTPREKVSVTEWSGKHRRLSRIASRYHGPYNTEITAFLNEIADCLSYLSEVNEIIFMKSAQLGGTEIANNFIGYTIDVDPCGILMVMPTDETVKRNSKVRIDPMIEDSPRLKKKVSKSKSRDAGNNIYEKSFPDGILIMTGANSPVALRSLPMRKVILDEVDGYPLNLGREGSPVSLAKARTRTFGITKKILLISTPTIHGLSVIEAEYENSDRRKRFVACPYSDCGHMQIITFDKIKWEKDENGQDLPETAKMQCEKCKKLIEERHKFHMVNNGVWIATNLEWKDKRRRGYWINALYSTIGYTWADAVKDFLESEKDPTKKITFVNTVLAETFKVEVEVPDWQLLYARREKYQMGVPPNEVLFLTCGVDVQKDRLELEIVGWSEGKVSHSINYIVIPGETSTDEPWDRLREIIEDDYVRADGAQMKILCTMVDSGYNTTKVYAFCNKFGQFRVIPIKGSDKTTQYFSSPKSVTISSNGKPIGQTKVWSIGTDVIKSELYGQLRLLAIAGKPIPVGYCHFPEYDDHYFKMLTAEEKALVVNKKGFKQYVWKISEGKRNEALDCRVYARAAASFLGMDGMKEEDWINLRTSIDVPGAPRRPVPPPKKKDNDYLDNDDYWS